MPRNPRKNIESRYWHVMVQGIGKEYVFPDDDSKGYYLASLQKAQEKINAKIIAFCVMSNHAHILLYVENTKMLSNYMNKVNSNYAMYYNRVNKRAGYVFRDRFRGEAIGDTRYLVNCAAYIQNNPINAGVVEKAEDYKHTSYTNYLTGKGIVNFEEAAKHFDVSPENMRAIMQEKSLNAWMEHDDKEYENQNNVLTELVRKYNINTNKLDDDLLLKIANDIHKRCGTSYREIASMLEVTRERLRSLVRSTPPSP